MQIEKLESLLRRAAMSGPRTPMAPECLDAGAIWLLLDQPKDVPMDDLRHVATCGYCRRAIALARQHRDCVDAPWEGEGDAEADSADAVGGDVASLAEQSSTRPRVLKLRRWLAIHPRAIGMAAVVILAVGVTWLMVPAPARHPDMLGSITGRFVLGDVVRGGHAPRKEYRVEVELKSPGYVTWLYLDFSRRLKLPTDQEAEAIFFPAGTHGYAVTVTDDPPGQQWIGAIASEAVFDAFTVRDDLQRVIDATPTDTPFSTIVARLERSLRDRPGFAFNGRTFEIYADTDP